MRPKSLSAEILFRGRASGLFRCPCGKPRAERARAPPSAFYVTFKVFLSFASGCQRAAPGGVPPGNQAAQYETSTGLADAYTARRPL